MGIAGELTEALIMQAFFLTKGLRKMKNYIGTLKETDGLRLRSYRAEDGPAIVKWIKDERTHAFWCANLLPYPLDEAAFERVRAEMEQKQGKRSFTVTTDDGELAGYFFMNTDTDDSSAFLGFVIVNDEMRGKGYGIKMLRLVKEYAFSVEGVEKIRLRVFDVNEAAVHCYKKAGFTAVEYEPEAFLFHAEKWGRYVMEAYR